MFARSPGVENEHPVHRVAAVESKLQRVVVCRQTEADLALPSTCRPHGRRTRLGLGAYAIARKQFDLPLA
jgi:hypothetical protein